MELDAVQLRDGYWAVRPKGAKGTCGWAPYPWHVAFVQAKSRIEAIMRAGVQVWEARKLVTAAGV